MPPGHPRHLKDAVSRSGPSYELFLSVPPLRVTVCGTPVRKTRYFLSLPLSL